MVTQGFPPGEDQSGFLLNPKLDKAEPKAALPNFVRKRDRLTPSSKGWGGGTSEVLLKGFGQTSLAAFVSSGACALRVLLV